ncbi:MAG: tRNA pseudouridine(38-40) synthase TruA [Pseudomonadota bacterium]
MRSDDFQKRSPARESRRFSLVLEYDGTAFRGWQKQGEATIRTVQGILLDRASELFGTDSIDIQGNGRTDAGVHALEYMAHLEVCTRLQAADIKDALNRVLPKDLVILDMQSVDARFHARHHCLGRSYLYQIAEEQRAFMKRYFWDLPEKLDVRLMQEAAAIFVDMHNFAAFAEKQEMKKSTKVLINALQLEQGGGMILVRVVASHFLWHLVRRLVGTIAAIGSGRLTLDEAKVMLETGQSTAIPWMAPAHGLFFEKALYDREAFISFAETTPLLPAPRYSRSNILRAVTNCAC